MKNGLIINEFESNPAGEDRGHEQVELLNNSAASIDLDGYTLTTAFDRRKKVMRLSGTISSGELLVIYRDFTLVNSSEKYSKNWEAVILKDPEGNEVDRTPMVKDNSDDGKTRQRSFDGSTEWMFADGMQGGSNSPQQGNSLASVLELKDSVWTAVQRFFDRVLAITDLDILQNIVQYMVRYSLEELIDMVSGRILEASVFVSLEVSDLTSSASAGMTVSLRTDGNLVEDVLRYITGKILEIVPHTDNPYSPDPMGILAKNINLEVTVQAGIEFPGILSDSVDLPQVDLDFTFKKNLSGITRILSTDTRRRL